MSFCRIPTNDAYRALPYLTDGQDGTGGVLQV